MAETLSDRLKQVPGLRQLMLLVGIAGAVAVGVTVFVAVALIYKSKL